MKTSDGINNDHRCPACGGRTAIDRVGKRYTHHLDRLPDGTLCPYGLGERDEDHDNDLHQERQESEIRIPSTEPAAYNNWTEDYPLGWPSDKIDIVSMRNPNWTRDELILALDLYLRVNPLNTSETNPEIVDLSALLNNLPIHPERADAETFRNPSGVYMKLCNFLRLDPSYEGEGLKAGSRVDEQVWNEFASDRQRLQDVANAIKIAATARLPDALASDDLTDKETAPEGRILTRIHRCRERNPELVQRKKASALKLCGALICEVCSFDFHRQYGPLGELFIECHHVRPLSTLVAEQRTKLDDLALVCANCHRMLHRGTPWPSVDQVRRLVCFRFNLVAISS